MKRSKEPKPAAGKPPTLFYDPAREAGRFKDIGGSQSDLWNLQLGNETVQTLWLKNSDEKTRERQVTATVDALMGIAPTDELEGMIAAQLIAAHSAAMECYRRAMIGEQTFEGRRENLSQANKLSWSFAVLLDALNRHRGKGQQIVRVEHVHVHSGGQAVVGAVATTGGGDHAKPEGQPYAIADAPQPALRCPDPDGPLLPITGNAERPLSNARRAVSGGTEGK
jgi:hypothetical protein